MEFKTAITRNEGPETFVRGKKLSELAEQKPFSDVVFLILKGDLPNEVESKVFAAMLTLCIDHGMAVSSAITTRFVQSTGNSLNTAIGAGVLTLGQYHGGAIEGCMKQLQEKKDPATLVSEALASKKRLLGYGQRIYKEEDPRTAQLRKLTKELGMKTPMFDYAFEIEAELEKQKGKKLVLNVDGTLAALLLGMGFPPEAGNGIFIIARVPGLVAHAVEERSEPPVRRFKESDIEYVGK